MKIRLLTLLILFASSSLSGQQILVQDNSQAGKGGRNDFSLVAAANDFFIIPSLLKNEISSLIVELIIWFFTCLSILDDYTPPPVDKKSKFFVKLRRWVHLSYVGGFSGS